MKGSDHAFSVDNALNRTLQDDVPGFALVALIEH